MSGTFDAIEQQRPEFFRESLNAAVLLTRSREFANEGADSISANYARQAAASIEMMKSQLDFLRQAYTADLEYMQSKLDDLMSDGDLSEFFGGKK